jgi:hypothetical protein
MIRLGIQIVKWATNYFGGQEGGQKVIVSGEDVKV